jgi:formylglycine-generating enzyme required for sulfatase activity
LVVKGTVFDAHSKEPLPFATIGVQGQAEEAISKPDGNYELYVPIAHAEDTLRATYLGYYPYRKKISELTSVADIYLEPSYTLLETVSVSRQRFNTRPLEKALRLIKGNLYAMETEVTNAQYNLFLADLEGQDEELLQQYDFNLAQYEGRTRDFFRRYATSGERALKTRDTTNVVRIGPHEMADYPAINVPHAGAVAYCRWLTDQYNAHPRRKRFKRVKFRLPTMQEWQIAALGYRKFQSWVLADNRVEVIIGEDTTSMMPRQGVRKSIQVGNDVLYPWFRSYHYRNSPSNHMGCFLGNFSVREVEKPCLANLPAFDGWSMMGRTASYFPNDMGLYDVVGNVAEMIDVMGMACGGSWDDPPLKSTIASVKKYSRPDATIGFRVFMEVLE